ncbi:sorbosone dehydrogenase family protein [Ignavibacterium sp.]|uniref:PQQ-dependent sugar dehydrogenase n=1 Tax=Ignavibacterium sp. TaxID=2651167 RepID=UPI00307CCCDE
MRVENWLYNIFPGILLLLNLSCTSKDETSNNQIKLPAGFKISVYAENIPNARSMELSESGILFVSTRTAGNVYALIDNDKNFKVDEVITIASGLDMPNGVALKDGDLYVAEVSRVIKFPQIETNLRNSPSFTIVRDDFPTARSHGWKFIKFGPDGKLYIPVGAPCNICLSEDPRFASIMRMNANGSELEIYSHGVRNTVGFDWHPITKDLWFTDNGRDMLGDNIPPDELNRAPEIGLHFGYPFLHGRNILDPEFGSQGDTSSYSKPVQELGPHVAALGMEFYTGNMFPEDYRNQIFIAEHGSWNRSKKIGYRISLVRLNGNEAISYEPFAEGWLQGESVSGRPVDVEQMPDGSLLISDDFANAIYRITYER